MNLWRNPEFQRQWWLELSATRLIAMPAVLLMVATGIWLSAPTALPGTAQAGFGVLVLLYGARLAHAALHDELREATWDMQRLSALTPWQLTWGKLLGGTLYAWYGGAICLLVWLAGIWALGGVVPWPLMVSLVAGGLGLQAGCLVLALIDLRRSSGAGGVGARGGGLWWLGALAAFLLIVKGQQFNEAQDPVYWWGWTIDGAVFLAAMLVVFAAWLILGAQRAMSEVLQQPLPPWAWIGWHAWLAVFTAGFLPDTVAAITRLVLACAGWSLLFAYTAALFDPPRWAVAQRLAARWSDGSMPWPQMPLALVSIVLALAAALWTFALGLQPTPFEQLPQGLHTLLLVASLLAVRDLALACAIQWWPRARRAEATTLLVWVLLHAVAPWLLHALGWQPAFELLQPLGTSAAQLGVIAVLAAAVQALLALGFAWQRWRAMSDVRPTA